MNTIKTWVTMEKEKQYKFSGDGVGGGGGKNRNVVAVVEEEKQCREAKKGGRKMVNCFFGGRKS